MGTAASDGKISANPCVIRGAGTTKRVHKIRPASLPELEKITNGMPAQYQAMILLASWCALRFGELTELRRRDVVIDADVQTGVIRIERAVVRAGDGYQVTTPKSEAGTRDVAIPPHFVPVVQAHLAQHVDARADALLFPAKHGGHLAPASLYRQFYKARDAANRPDLRFHDLRHSGAVLAAATGATLAELMARLGHSTPRSSDALPARRPGARSGDRREAVGNRAWRVIRRRRARCRFGFTCRSCPRGLSASGFRPFHCGRSGRSAGRLPVRLGFLPACHPRLQRSPSGT
jgi:integrase